MRKIGIRTAQNMTQNGGPNVPTVFRGNAVAYWKLRLNAYPHVEKGDE